MALPLRIVTVLFLTGRLASSVLAAQPLAEKPPAPEPLRTFTGHGEAVQSVAFSADGKSLASGSLDKTAKVWDVATGQERATFRGRAEADVAANNRRLGMDSVAFTPDNKILVAGSLDGTVRVWDVATKRELRTLRGHSSGVLAISIAPDGKTLASASEDRTLRIWEVGTGNQESTLFGHSG